MGSFESVKTYHKTCIVFGAESFIHNAILHGFF
jgi:hypothetical protein